MRKYFALALFFGIISCKTQTAPVVKTESSVMMQANTMLAAMKKGDIETFAQYTYPKVIEMLGGRDQFIQGMQKSLQGMTDQGFKYDSIQLEEPSGSFKCGGELQCMLRQTMVMTRKGEEPRSMKSYLIAISSDGGNRWTFINADVNDIPKLKQYMPNICDSLLQKME